MIVAPSKLYVVLGDRHYVQYTREANLYLFPDLVAIMSGFRSLRTLADLDCTSRKRFALEVATINV